MTRSLADDPSLVLVSDEAAEPSEDLTFAEPFELVCGVDRQARRLAAIGLRLAGDSLAAEAELEVAVLAGDEGETLGLWRLPADAIPERADWLTLEFAASLAEIRRDARVRVRGRPGTGGRLRLARAAGAEPCVALRLYAARGPRLADSPYWIWPGANGLPTTAAVRVAGASWRDGRHLGAASALEAPPDRKRLRLEPGASAMWVFPDVALDERAAIVARVAREGEGEGEIEATLALSPTRREFGSDPDAERAEALTWSMAQGVGAETMAVSLALPVDAPATAAVALWLRDLGPSAAKASVVRCEGLWLVPRRRGKPAPSSAAIAPAHRQQPSLAATFEDVRLDAIYSDGHYRHLDLSVAFLSKAGRMWRAVKFKLFDDGGSPGLEFRRREDWPACFALWPGTEEDAYGPFFKIVGAEGLDEAARGLPDENDRLLLAAIAETAPELVRRLIGSRQIEAALGKTWLAVAAALTAG